MNISKLQPHLGELNDKLKDIGIVIAVRVDSNDDIMVDEDGKPYIIIDSSEKWFPIEADLI